MRLQQKIGPFTNNEVLFNIKNVRYLQLGIEHPHSIPLSELEDLNSDSDWPLLVSINKGTAQEVQKDFILTTKDILEYTPNGFESLTIIIKKEVTNPYIIINAAYENAD